MTTFLTETFTAAAGAALETLTGWSKHASLSGSSMVISDVNRARVGTAVNQSNLYLNSATPGNADVDVAADVVCKSASAGTYCFLCARMATGSLDGYMAGVSGGNAYQIWKYTAGGLAAVGASSAKTFIAGTTYPLLLTVRTVGGNAVVTLYENGVQKCQYTDSTAPVLTAGKVGIWMNNVGNAAGNTTDYHVDNLVGSDTTSPITRAVSRALSRPLSRTAPIS